MSYNSRKNGGRIMFEDIVGAKFEGVDIGTRDIISEVKVQLNKGLNFGIEQLEIEDKDEFIKILNEYADENIDTLAQMYMDEFSSEEIITMLDFEMTPLAEKKLKFQIKMQQFISDGFMKKIMEDVDVDFDDDPVKNIFDALGGPGGRHEDDDFESFMWDSKEEGKE
jgi:hypothetical protein